MKSFRTAGAAAAFSLVEVVLALGVTSFCLIVLVGLLSVSLQSNQSTLHQAVASAALSSVVSDLYATPVAATATTQFKLSIPSNTGSGTVQTLWFTSDGQVTNTATGSACRLTLTPISPSAGGGAKTATLLDVKVTWPAQNPPATATGVVESFVALNRN